MTRPYDERIFGMTGSRWEEFQFITGQLGVIDNKAKSILQINAILIAITNIGFFIVQSSKEIMPEIPVLRYICKHVDSKRVVNRAAVLKKLICLQR